MQIVAETSIRIDRGHEVVSGVLKGLAKQIISYHREGRQTVVIFHGSKVRIEFELGTILLRVEADDCITCLGTKNLLIAAIGKVVDTMPARVRWVECE